jgi:hypothetical protein
VVWNTPGLHAAVFGNGASGAVIFCQNSSVERSTPAEYVSSPKVTMRGTTAIPSEAALAGSKSDAESVTMATRPTAGPSSNGRCVARDDTSRGIAESRLRAEARCGRVGR